MTGRLSCVRIFDSICSNRLEVHSVDDRRFDSLVRSLAVGGSRRQVLKAVLGLGAGATVGALAMVDEADAARRGFSGPRIFPCVPQCDGSSCGDDGCGGRCSCATGCDCLADDLQNDAFPRICVGNLYYDPSELCTDSQFACDPNSAFPICEPVSGACISACSPI
jgi:hypothetical protein